MSFDVDNPDLDYIGLLGDGDRHMDHLWGPGVIVVVGLVLIIVIVRELSVAC